MAEKCPECGKFLTETWWGYICKCGYEETVIEEPQEPNREQIVNQEIHDHFWFGNEPTTEEAKEYTDFWHGGK